MEPNPLPKIDFTKEIGPSADQGFYNHLYRCFLEALTDYETEYKIVFTIGNGKFSPRIAKKYGLCIVIYTNSADRLFQIENDGQYDRPYYYWFNSKLGGSMRIKVGLISNATNIDELNEIIKKSMEQSGNKPFKEDKQNLLGFEKKFTINNGTRLTEDILKNTEDSSVKTSFKAGLREVITEFEKVLAEVKETNGTTTDENEETPGMKNTIASKIDEVLKDEKNVVLTGSPGTGKTYAVKQYVAERLGYKSWRAAKDDLRVELVQFHQSYDYTDFIEGYRPNLDSPTGEFILKNGIFKEFCEKAEKAISGTIDNFDASWAKLLAKLEDETFITVPLLSGKRSLHVELNENGDGLTERSYTNNEDKAGKWEQGKSKFFSMEQLRNIYRGLPGTPKKGHDNYRKAIVEYMKDAANGIGLQAYQSGNPNSESDEKYYFIIDEINRADLSKVFGEVMMCLEDGYRGEPVMTQYGSTFSIPNNVIIIGTMNDIDRSVESFDFALRRRFRWMEIDADEYLESTLIEMWKEKMPEDFTIKELVKHIKVINEVISSPENGGKLGLNKDYKIGAAYFKPAEMGLNDYLTSVWNTKINPLLKEYTRGYSSEQVTKFCDKCEEALLNPGAENSEKSHA